MKRVVIKVGTNVITKESGLLNRPVMGSIVAQIAELKRRKVQVILVSSGAVAAGRMLLMAKKEAMENIPARQLLAAVGQVKLMEIYAKFFLKNGYHSAQVLATKEDFRDRHHYLCMRECFTSLLHDDIVPIVNENDVVAIEELMFTDNDELAGLLASMLNADSVIILTSVAGLYDGDPKEKTTKLIETVSVNDTFVLSPTEKSTFGKGGMHTKYRVAKELSLQGITTHIVHGKIPNILLDVIDGKKVGTTFEPRKKMSGIKKWIGQAKGLKKGAVVLNECAEEIFKSAERAHSLLPVGITQIIGDFDKGDIIEIQNSKGESMGYGRAEYGSLKAWEGMGQKNRPCLVHYDYLYIYKF